jgi:hypothetical protein
MLDLSRASHDAIAPVGLTDSISRKDAKADSCKANWQMPGLCDFANLGVFA